MSEALPRNTKRVVVIEGEDASPEAVRPTVALLESLGLAIEWIVPENQKDSAPITISASTKAAIDDSDATLFGSTSGASQGALFYLRWGKGTFANVRPTRWHPGCPSPLADPEGIDFVIVRENLEDMYVRIEGEPASLAPLNLMSPTMGRAPHTFENGKFALKLITEENSERVIRFAFELARKRKANGHPGRLTLSSKYNMLPQTDGLFKAVGDRLALEYPDIEYQSFIVDNFCRHMVADPQSLDVVVLPNLYGDLLSDLAAGLVGGLGLAASGCYSGDYAYFESAHGTAPDIAGENAINPTATILSACLLLEHLGFSDDAVRIRNSIDAMYAEGEALTRDMGGVASTTEFCEELKARLASMGDG